MSQDQEQEILPKSVCLLQPAFNTPTTPLFPSLESELHKIFMNQNGDSKDHHPNAPKCRVRPTINAAIPSGPSFGDFVVWKGETATPTPAPAWSDSGKIARHTSLRYILKEQENKGGCSSVQQQQHQVHVPMQKSMSSSVQTKNGPSWSSRVQIMSHSGTTLMYYVASIFVPMVVGLSLMTLLGCSDVYPRLKGVLSQVLPILGNVKDQHRPIFANAFRCWCQACWQYSVEYPLSSILNSDVTNNPSEGVFVGLLLPMSLTTVVLKFLMEKNSVNALHRKVCWYFRKFG
ncbi:unnamed protein product [Lactuca saligna]|uniref:Uncharacterized protein n=1 Tax=Lactuca saligna TaxID=75948 RepID=A0AA35ZI92_LACSI|nr:unnamed protein product [Lactuca saligna]